MALRRVLLNSPADAEAICKNFKARTSVDARTATEQPMNQWERGLHVDGACADPDDLVAQLAAMAEPEAASVPAFERLACELAAHGAPSELIRRARVAMRDEVRHACVMRELAAQYGGRRWG